MSVLFGVNMIVGWLSCVIVLVIVKVLFEFVMLSSVWKVRLLLMFLMSVLIVVGWLFVGGYGW